MFQTFYRCLLPSAVAINSATFIGYRVAGFIGAIFSLLGILLPALTNVVGI
ncbi:chromate transporter [Cytobacillus horneckiae]|uniref:chromate transporter n=1 Tax=Cytobacillus horneckiae TaxID=549687 RepID=UPI003D9AA6A4